jgi:hypothetical protein
MYKLITIPLILLTLTSCNLVDGGYDSFEFTKEELKGTWSGYDTVFTSSEQYQIDTVTVTITEPGVGYDDREDLRTLMKESFSGKDLYESDQVLRMQIGFNGDIRHTGYAVYDVGNAGIYNSENNDNTLLEAMEYYFFFDERITSTEPYYLGFTLNSAAILDISLWDTSEYGEYPNTGQGNIQYLYENLIN